VHLENKINDPRKILSRFAEMEKILPNFNQLFENYLSQKYDHLSEQNLVYNNDLIKTEILDRLKQCDNLSDAIEDSDVFGFSMGPYRSSSIRPKSNRSRS
jgi:hypothetical protein